MRVHRRKGAVSILYVIAASLILVMPHTRHAVAQGKVTDVDCANKTIAKELEKAKPGDTIRVSGTCNEALTISTDRVTLEGQAGAVIDGGGGNANVITIEGVQGVVLSGFTIQNGNIGILARRGAVLTLNQVILQDHALFGLRVDENSSVRITEITAQRNGRSGIRISEQSSAIIQGTIVSSQNGDDGIQIINGSRGSLRPTTLQMNGNADAGLVVSFGSSAAIIGGTLEAMQNVDGLRLESSASLLLFGLTSAALTDNSNNGLLAFEGASILAQNSTIVASRNATGIAVTTNSDITLSGGFDGGDPTVVTAENNTGVGLRVAGGGRFATSEDPLQAAITLSIRQNGGGGVTADAASLTLQNATVTDNTTDDMVLSFGAQATLNDVTIGVLTCDETVLSRGSPVCP